MTAGLSGLGSTASCTKGKLTEEQIHAKKVRVADVAVALWQGADVKD